MTNERRRTGIAHSPSYVLPAITVARNALKRGPFVKLREYYGTGSRRFAASTVNKLIERGEAVRVGTGVVHVNHLQWRNKVR